MSQTIEEKLRVLNVFPNSIDETAEIFQKVQNEEDVKKEMGERSYSCGSEQFIFFHFHSLLGLQPEILQEAEKQLSDLGVSPEHIKEYMKDEQQQSLIFTLRHEDKYPFEVREPFYQKANQFTLDRIKQYLTISGKPYHNQNSTL